MKTAQQNGCLNRLFKQIRNVQNRTLPSDDYMLINFWSRQTGFHYTFVFNDQFFSIVFQTPTVPPSVSV